jgi:PucR family transcriptional regulator, purine catabolism regulatory protein
MAMKLRTLLAVPALGLVVRCPGETGALDAVVQWVHQSELSDSTLFTEPGEVLLTTGSHLPGAADATEAELAQLCDAYVRRLSESQVVGLGFGVGVNHPTSPQPLVAAARRYGLPLFEVPYEIPFSAVIKAVSKSLSDAEHAYLRRTNSAQRRLITAVGRSQVPQSVVRSTAQIIGGWAALSDPVGRLGALSPTAKSAAAQAAVQSHLNSGQQVSFPGTDAGRVCAHSVVSEGRLLAILVTGANNELDPLAISTSMLAANLLAVHLSLSGRLQHALDNLRAPLISETLAGRTELTRQLAGTLWPKLPLEPLILSCVEGPGEEISRLPLNELAAVWGVVGERLWVISSADQTPRLTTAVADQGELELGSSQPTTWNELGQAKHQALNALLTGSKAANRPALLDLLPPDQAQAFAQATLGDLLQPEAAELLQTVRAWADQDGSFDRTAGELGVHRHTVRRRLQRVEEILSRRLDDPSTRHEIWFACQLADQLAAQPAAAVDSHPAAQHANRAGTQRADHAGGDAGAPRTDRSDAASDSAA